MPHTFADAFSDAEREKLRVRKGHALASLLFIYAEFSLRLDT